MKAGLPLRSLKVVIFSRNIDNISKADQPLFDLFQKLKNDHEQKEKENNEVGDQEIFGQDIYKNTIHVLCYLPIEGSDIPISQQI